MENKYGERFEKAIARVLENEGEYVNDVNDNGGEMKFCISKRSYPNLDIRNLTLDGAKFIYYMDFLEPQSYKYFKSEDLAEKTFDLAVNIGSKKANELLQRALLAVGNPVK